MTLSKPTLNLQIIITAGIAFFAAVFQAFTTPQEAAGLAEQISVILTAAATLYAGVGAILERFKKT